MRTWELGVPPGVCVKETHEPIYEYGSADPVYLEHTITAGSYADYYPATPVKRIYNGLAPSQREWNCKHCESSNDGLECTHCGAPKGRSVCLA